MALTPNIFDIARIERLLHSINAKVGTIESIMIEEDEKLRDNRNDEEENTK